MDDNSYLVWGDAAGEISGPNESEGVYVATRFIGKPDYAGYNWQLVDADGYAVFIKPTHWMPLPERPEAAA